MKVRVLFIQPAFASFIFAQKRPADARRRCFPHLDNRERHGG